jgi:hypothetical protein
MGQDRGGLWPGRGEREVDDPVPNSHVREDVHLGERISANRRPTTARARMLAAPGICVRVGGCENAQRTATGRPCFDTSWWRPALIPEFRAVAWDDRARTRRARRVRASGNRAESTTESTTPGVVDSAARESRARVSIRPRWRGLALRPDLAARGDIERNRQQIGYESTTAHLTSGPACSGLRSRHAAEHLCAFDTAGIASIDHRIDNRIDNETRPASGHDRDPPGRKRRRDPAPPADSITCVRSGCSMSRRHGSCPCALTTARR